MDRKSSGTRTITHGTAIWKQTRILMIIDEEDCGRLIPLGKYLCRLGVTGEDCTREIANWLADHPEDDLAQ